MKKKSKLVYCILAGVALLLLLLLAVFFGKGCNKVGRQADAVDDLAAGEQKSSPEESKEKDSAVGSGKSITAESDKNTNPAPKEENMRQDTAKQDKKDGTVPFSAVVEGKVLPEEDVERDPPIENPEKEQKEETDDPKPEEEDDRRVEMGTTEGEVREEEDPEDRTESKGEAETAHEPALLKWEEFFALSSAEKDAYLKSFDDYEAFFNWMLAAQEAFKKEYPDIEIGPGGEIDLSKIG